MKSLDGNPLHTGGHRTNNRQCVLTTALLLCITSGAILLLGGTSAREHVERISTPLLQSLRWSSSAPSSAHLEWPFGPSVFYTYEGEMARWRKMLEGVFRIEDDVNPEPGCPPEWAIVNRNNALLSFEDLARQQTRRRISIAEGSRMLSDMGVDVAVLTVEGLTARHERQRASLVLEGIGNFIWQVGWDSHALPPALDIVRGMIAEKASEERLTSPDMSLAMKHLATMTDWVERSPQTHSAYAAGLGPASAKSKPVFFPQSATSRHLLILEDDSMLVPEFLPRLEQLIAHLPDDYAFVSLGACCADHVESPAEILQDGTSKHIRGPFTFSYRKHDLPADRGWPWVRCAGTYLVNRESAREMLEIWHELALNATNIDGYDLHFNTVLQHDIRTERHRLGKTFWAEPPLTVQSTKALHDDQGHTASSLRVMGFSDDQ